MHPTKLFRTSSFRLTALYATVFAASVLILFSAVYYKASSYMAEQLDHAIDAEVSVLEAEAMVGDLTRVASVIAERETESARSGTVYLLQNVSGQTLAGNIPLRHRQTGWFELQGRSRAAEGEEPHRIRAHGINLAGGGYLVVGQDANAFDEMRELMIRAFGWSLVAILLLGILGGMFMSWSVLRRVGSVARTSQAIMAGDLTHRVEDRGVGDEFDQLAHTLNAMLDRIETLMEGLRQVSNDIAHDLRTPLSRLRQRWEAIQRGGCSVADYETLVDRSLQDMDSILETFSAILRIAEIESASRVAAFIDVDLTLLLQTILEVYEPLAVENAQTLIGTIAADLSVRGDRDLLMQLFANLVENALKHTPRGTQVTVAARRLGDRVEAMVADSGAGVPEAERTKVFRRFYRLEPSRHVPGSGLGLSLVAAVATMHSLEIELADNAPGLRIRLIFPSITTTTSR